SVNATAIVMVSKYNTLGLCFSRDDGCGINAANQSRIFEPFFTTARELGGSGLGLHLVYNLVTQTLRGHIQLESSSGQGATFTITFPRD
ncbi:MAG: ATP-binding protein, partial [Cyanobacteria bacterium J06598_3]